jgi:hypothetical protein
MQVIEIILSVEGLDRLPEFSIEDRKGEFVRGQLAELRE